jgi:flagellar secretion chaperone FliS
VYGVNQYQSAAIDTAGPAQLVLMLYDGALVRLEIATESIEAGNAEAAHTALIKAQAIIDELNVTLDMDKGGAVAENLRDIYLYCSSRLVEANLSKDATIVAEVARLIKPLRDAWDQACVRSAVSVA